MFYVPKALLTAECYASDPSQWKGEHAFVGRSVYTHHGVLDGAGGVIHYAKNERGKKQIARTSFDRFLGDQERAIVVDHPMCRTPEDAVAFAEQYIGMKDYNVAFKNCEHFATECVQGVGESRQADTVVASFIPSFGRLRMAPAFENLLRDLVLLAFQPGRRR